MNVVGIVTQRILEKLDKGVIPWRKPWNVPDARNWKSGRRYTGINRLLLDSGEYVSYKQCVEAGGVVKKGEKAQPVIFYTMTEYEDRETGEKKKCPVIRYYNVFEISQCRGLERKIKNFEPLKFRSDEKAEEIITKYADKPEIKHGDGEAYYSPMLDFVNVPNKELFCSIGGYYSTLFHELIHSTGHKNRLSRRGITDPIHFGTSKYGREELIAEIGAASLCSMAHIDTTLDNSASYIDSWKEAIRGDSNLIVVAAQQAQKAVDFIIGKKENSDYQYNTVEGV